MHQPSPSAMIAQNASAPAKSGYLRKALIGQCSSRNAPGGGATTWQKTGRSSSQRLLGVDHQREIEAQETVLRVVETLVLHGGDELRARETGEQLLRARE